MNQPYYLPKAPTGSSSANKWGEVPTVVHSLTRAPQFELKEAQSESTTGRLFLHLILLSLTIVTTVGVGVIWFYNPGEPMTRAVEAGFVYSFTIIVILAAHELGHYIACRWYGVNATLPFFIPMPIPPVGTFGAFIKIKSPIPTRCALFDIGIAGPLAGFVFAIPAAYIAHYFAQPARAAVEGEIYFQNPLLFKFFEYYFGLPPVIEMNPVWWAAWIGVFMTSLNLLPVGQLDGGHVTFAVFGHRGHRRIAIGCYLAVIALAIYTMRGGMWNWVVYALILTLMLRIGHPPVVDDREPLGLTRKIIAVIGLIVFVLSFMPFPISI